MSLLVQMFEASYFFVIKSLIFTKAVFFRKKYTENSNIVKYNYYINYQFSILIHFDKIHFNSH